jgi:hypothetical protein
MSKHIDKDYLYNLPSGASVHPCRLILKDGTLMWKHALLCRDNHAVIPTCESHEQHIQKHETLEQRDGLLFFRRC